MSKGNDSQLHEILAVDRDLENQAKKIVEETTHDFSKRRELFIGSQKNLTMFDESRKVEEISGFSLRKLETTVPDRLKYTSKFLIKHFDAIAQKEFTNQQAKADLIIGGKTILKDVPATLLLTLETKLVSWRHIFVSIPTLGLGVQWIKDNAIGKGVYRVEEPRLTLKTEKIMDYNIIVPATKEHPAEIREFSKDTPVGQYKEEVWCGMITSADKAELLNRIDKLIKAVKKARARANQEIVVPAEIGSKLWNFITSEVI